MNKTSIIFGIMLIVLIADVMAFAGQLPPPDYTKQASSGCVPPMSFAETNNCSLRYNEQGYVGVFKCEYIGTGGYYEVQSDCQGNVVKATPFYIDNGSKVSQFSVFKLTFLIISIALLILAYYAWKINRGGKHGKRS